MRSPQYISASLAQRAFSDGRFISSDWVPVAKGLNKFWNSPAYFPTLSILALLFFAGGEAFAGILVMLYILTAYLALCPDLLACFYPFLLILLLGTQFYENLGTLMKYWWLGIPFAAVLVRRLYGARGVLHMGRCTKGLIGVSLATLLGGVGVISAKEYFSPVGLFYTLGLGIFMLGFYQLLHAEFAKPRSYDVAGRFAAILYAAGLFTAALVVYRYIAYPSILARHFQVIHIPCRNFFATMLLMSLPTPCYFMLTEKRHALGLAFLYGAALFTGSRSALLFGTLLLSLSLLWFFLHKGFSRRRVIRAGLWLFAGMLLLIFFAKHTIFVSRTVDGVLISTEDSRIAFFLQALRDFAAHPLTGLGLGNMQNSIIFLGVPGSMVWYHNYFAQILGSLGIIGVAGYSVLLYERGRLAWSSRGTNAEVLALAYLGMLMISMTNPGEFTPLPGEFLVVALFAAMENSVSLKKCKL